MNHRGSGAFPSTITLASETALSERTVCTHIKDACKAGWLERKAQGKKGQGWARNAYSARLPMSENDRFAEQGTERGSVPCSEFDRDLSTDALKDVQHVGAEGAERLSVPSHKALNVMHEGTERGDKKALKEVQSNYSYNYSMNRSIDDHGSRLPAKSYPQTAIRLLELPPWISQVCWMKWCSYRESLLPDIDWDLNLAKASLTKLEMYVQNGYRPEDVIECTIERRSLKLYVSRKLTSQGNATAIHISEREWWKSSDGITRYAQKLNLEKLQTETFPEFKLRVFKCAGPGPWIDEALIQAERESPKRYQELLRYFDGVGGGHSNGRGS